MDSDRGAVLKLFQAGHKDIAERKFVVSMAKMSTLFEMNTNVLKIANKWSY